MKPVWIVSAAMLVMASSSVNAKSRAASCQLMQRLAQQHANDMARRESLDHAGFMTRARRGARAENVAMGHSSRAKTMAQWRASPQHASNMRLPGCKGVAYAVSRSGRYYWAMEIAQ
ncbi:MAG: CAP domain-containing protein [Xanthobacteraceae bacterium]|nr:CAP domain-containing protein [Xanthobacteraceae bacterium]